jgi:hypothetical protein
MIMGCYVNPRGETKEDFLRREGRVISVNEATAPPSGCTAVFRGEYAVCLVHNGAFTAAAVAYDHHELAALTRVEDPRPKIWYLVPREKLLEVCDIAQYDKKC